MTSKQFKKQFWMILGDIFDVGAKFEFFMSLAQKTCFWPKKHDFFFRDPIVCGKQTKWFFFLQKDKLLQIWMLIDPLNAIICKIFVIFQSFKKKKFFSKFFREKCFFFKFFSKNFFFEIFRKIIFDVILPKIWQNNM